MASHHPPVITFNCPTCGKKFKEKSSLSAHYTIVHAENPRKFKCDVCPSAFSKKVNLNYHKKRKHQGVSNAGSGSGTTMNTNTQYISISTGLNHNGQNYTSTGNPQSQGPRDTVSSIIDSIASNTDLIPSLPPPPSRTMVNTEGEFKCEYCGKGFQFRNNLKAHYKTHLREKTYSCDLCDKSFVYKESLKNHMLLHSGEFPYLCNICNKKFRDRSNRRKHVKNVHKVLLPNGAPLPASITSTEPSASTSGAATGISYRNGGSGNGGSSAMSYSATLVDPSAPRPPVKRRRAKKNVQADPLGSSSYPPAFPNTSTRPKKPGKKGRGKNAAPFDPTALTSSRDTSNRSVIVSPKTISSHDYGLLSPALPVTVHMPSTSSSLPSFHPQPHAHPQSQFERNIIVKAESSDLVQDQHSLFHQQHSHPNVIVYPKAKPLDYASSDPAAQQHPHSVISQSHYYEPTGSDGRCYQQGTADGPMAQYYVSLMSTPQSQSISPENTTTGSFESPSSPYVNVGMLPSSSSSTRLSGRNSIESPVSVDPLQQYTSTSHYLTDSHVSSIVNESYPQFWSSSSTQPASSSSQPYYVSATTGSGQLDPSSRPIITAPSYIPPQTTVSTSASSNSISNSSATNYYTGLNQQFDYNY